MYPRRITDGDHQARRRRIFLDMIFIQACSYPFFAVAVPSYERRNRRVFMRKRMPQGFCSWRGVVNEIPPAVVTLVSLCPSNRPAFLCAGRLTSGTLFLYSYPWFSLLALYTAMISHEQHHKIPLSRKVSVYLGTTSLNACRSSLFVFPPTVIVRHGTMGLGVIIRG